MPPWLALALGLITAVALGLTFRYEGVERRVLRESPVADALQIAYLTAWLTAHPDDHGLRLVLVRGLTRRGDFDIAREHLRMLDERAATFDYPLLERLALQSLDTDITALYALPLDDPRRPEALQAVRDRLRQLARTSWSEAVEGRLVEQAVAVAANDAAVLLYSRALDRGYATAPGWWQRAAEQMLGLREVSLAVRLFLRARTSSRTLEGQRRNFIAALQALRGDNRLTEALRLAEEEIGPLAGDTATLEYLTRLALAAGRPDIAQRYALQMMKLTLLPTAIRAWQARFLTAPPSEWTALLEQLPPSLTPVQADAQPEPELRSPKLPFDDARYQLSFEVFLANNNLRDAIAVARAAVRHAPRSLTWRRRLAQVADWSGDALLALEQWHAIAQLTGESEAWKQVEVRAPTVFDYTRWLAAVEYRLKSTPNDLELIERIAELHERMGEPEKALAFLQRHTRGPHRRVLLGRIAELAYHLGDAETRREALAAKVREFGSDPGLATALASVELARGDRAAALAAMRAARGTARASDVSYWSAYAALAMAQGNALEALRALQVLIDAGTAPVQVLLDAARLLEEDDPQRAAELTARAYAQSGTPLHAARVLTLFDRGGRHDAARAFLAQLSGAQLTVLERDVGFLQQRALLWLASDAAPRAVADSRRALQLSPNNSVLRALLLWALVVQRDAATLRAELRALAKEAARTPELWGPVGAAWLALNEPAQALPHLTAQARDSRDYLWLLTLADATELAGDVERAWRLRNVAWREIRARPLPSDASLVEKRQRLARLATLAPIFEPGDRARGRQATLLATVEGRAEPLAREALLAAWISTEQSELALAWLLAQYSNALARPAWAELSLALGSNDQPWIGRLLDDVPDWLPLYDRIEAAQRVGRIALAQSFAFDGLAAQPVNDELHLRLRNTTTPHTDFFGGGVQRFAQKPLTETSIGLDGAERVSPGLQLFAGLRHLERRSTDTALLVEALPNEDVASFGALLHLEHDGQLRATVQQSNGLSTRTTLQIDAEADIARRVRLSVSAARAAPTSESPTLRIGGERNALAVNVLARIATREYVAARVEFNRYRSTDGAALGNGHTLRLEAGHDLRLEAPELRLRATLADTTISARAGSNVLLASLLPEAARPGATNAGFLPSAGTRVSLTLSAGDSVREDYTRAWRPFAALGIGYENTRAVGGLAAPASGSGIDWSLGAAGSLFGTDRLVIGLEGGSRRGPGANAFSQLTVRYQWLH